MPDMGSDLASQTKEVNSRPCQTISNEPVMLEEMSPFIRNNTFCTGDRHENWDHVVITQVLL